jgi:hypothetical protein
MLFVVRLCLKKDVSRVKCEVATVLEKSTKKIYNFSSLSAGDYIKKENSGRHTARNKKLYSRKILKQKTTWENESHKDDYINM